jgi:coronin-7
LGPKPFSSGTSGEFSFDKVFSVPQVPGQEDSNRDTVAMDADSPPASFSPVKEKNEEESVEEHTNGNNDNGHDAEEVDDVELRQKEDDEAADTVEKIRTTAERRRVSGSCLEILAVLAFD